MTEKPNFFYKIENNHPNPLGDEFNKAFTPDPKAQLPQARDTQL